MQAFAATGKPTATRSSVRRTNGVKVQAVFRLITRPNVGTPAKRPVAGLSPASVADVSATAVTASTSSYDAERKGLTFHGVHHVALICSNLERSLEFYQGVLGLETNPDRPDDKLPYRGAWLWIGPEMIHLMELPNPDPTERAKRPGVRALALTPAAVLRSIAPHPFPLHVIVD